MPMLQQLGNKNSRELKPIPKRLENETDEEYAKTIAKVKEDILIEENLEELD